LLKNIFNSLNFIKYFMNNNMVTISFNYVKYNIFTTTIFYFTFTLLLISLFYHHYHLTTTLLSYILLLSLSSHHHHLIIVSSITIIIISQSSPSHDHLLLFLLHHHLFFHHHRHHLTTTFFTITTTTSLTLLLSYHHLFYHHQSFHHRFLCHHHYIITSPPLPLKSILQKNILHDLMRKHFIKSISHINFFLFVKYVTQNKEPWFNLFFIFIFLCCFNGQMLDGSKCQMAKHDLFSFPLVCKHPTWLDWKKHCFSLSLSLSLSLFLKKGGLVDKVIEKVTL